MAVCCQIEGRSALENGQTQRSALIAVDVHLGETRHDGKIHIVLLQIATRNGDGLDSLVDCTGTDCLHLGIAVFTHNAGNGAGD